MTRAPDLKSIDCTACGAGLDILGGGRVTTHICPYCGTELDALDGYKALKRFGDLPRPDTPFSVGDQGRIKDVDWTIIGTLGLEERYGGKVETWAEHQLFSPTHGYAWLTVENGHTTFSRRQRRLPNHWITPRQVETSESKPTTLLDGERFTYIYSTEARLTFAEGEFTWTPTVGDVTYTVSAMSATHMLDFSWSGQEKELYRSEYLDPVETLTAFGRDPKALRPKGLHPLQPFNANPTLTFIKHAAAAFALISVLLALILSMGRGETVYPERTFALRALPLEMSFEITQPNRLAGLYLRGDASNSWAYVDLEVTDPEDETLFEAGRTMEYYFGRDGDGAWSEGSNSASLRFLPNGVGTYTLTISAAETGLWNSIGYQSSAPTSLTVSARQGMSSGRSLFGLAVGFALISVLLWARRLLHSQRRWAHSDWDDD